MRGRDARQRVRVRGAARRGAARRGAARRGAARHGTVLVVLHIDIVLAAPHAVALALGGVTNGLLQHRGRGEELRHQVPVEQLARAPAGAGEPDEARCEASGSSEEEDGLALPRVAEDLLAPLQQKVATGARGLRRTQPAYHALVVAQQLAQTVAVGREVAERVERGHVVGLWLGRERREPAALVVVTVRDELLRRCCVQPEARQAAQEGGAS